MDIILDGPSQPPLSCGKPKYLVILLHGAASNGDEIIELALDWAPTLNKAEFLAPNAPWLSDGESNRRQWTCPTDNAQHSGAGLDEAAERLQVFLDAVLAKRRLEDSQLALVGFAQGAALALRAGLTRAKPPGAIVAVAGGIDEVPIERNMIRSGPPVLLVEADVEAGAGAVGLDQAQHQLAKWGIPIQRLAKPGSYHGLDDDGVSTIADYLHRALVKPSAD
ncbi:alpha/beta hydrolase [Methylocaldum sp. 14B]|uniref:alpha/beta hydrolase n=1 Tax=unclassified Methylocaldum TaxID=2622260 RepID=UPI00098B0C5D|nr:hypothetical protein [Methylocaldum sp. 14B]MVF22150.1 phospholipase [Methylocaldum sp. BRCS4]